MTWNPLHHGAGISLQRTDGETLVRVTDDLPHYLLANPHSGDFSQRPEESAFLPDGGGPLTVDVPVQADGPAVQVLVLQYTGTDRRTFYGDEGTSRMSFTPDADADAFTLAIRVVGEGTVTLGTPRLDRPQQGQGMGQGVGGPSSERGQALTDLVRSFLPRIDNRTAVERTRALVKRNVAVLKGDVEFDLGRKDAWATARGRATKRLFHGFLFLPEVAGAVQVEPELAAPAAQRVLQAFDIWHEVHAERGAGPDEMAWHDETTAQRITNLLSWFDAVEGHLSEEQKHRFWGRLAGTVELLVSENFHAAGNNHGMFQDWALLYYAVLAPDLDPEVRRGYVDTSVRRLMEYFDACFTSEGVHVENSPSYHLMAGGYLRQLVQVTRVMGHPRSADYDRLLGQAARYATHALMPNGVYPPISDTTQSVIRRTLHADLFDDAEYHFAVNRGQAGREPAQRVLVLPTTGYAVYRSSWSSEDAAFLFFSAAYSANYHKHSDDLSLFLRSDGVDLLCESGPYGYDYSHPYSQYAYSQFSHNSLVVDGRSLPRTDNKFAAVSLEDHRPVEAALDVTGTNARYEDVRHTRRVRVDEEHDKVRISVTDEIRAARDHEYELLWNLGPKVKSTVADEGFTVRSGGRELLSARIDSTVPWEIRRFEGVNDPAPRGWRFPAFGRAQPAQQLSVRFRGKDVSVSTVFTLLSPAVAPGVVSTGREPGLS